MNQIPAPVPEPVRQGEHALEKRTSLCGLIPALALVWFDLTLFDLAWIWSCLNLTLFEFDLIRIWYCLNSICLHLILYEFGVFLNWQVPAPVPEPVRQGGQARPASRDHGHPQIPIRTGSLKYRFEQVLILIYQFCGKKLQFKTSWQWSLLHSMIFIGDGQAFVQ